MDFIDQALNLLRINSVTSIGNEKIVDYLIPIFESLQAKIIVQKVEHSIENYNRRQFNIIGILGDDLVESKTSKGLLLLSHLDTAYPGNLSHWKRLNSEPWSPQVDKDKIIGLGAANAKLDFLCKLEACKQFVDKKLAQPIYLAATCGAESSFFGSKYLMDSKALNPKYALIGHPTSLQIMNHHKSQMSTAIQLSFATIQKDAREFNVRVEIKALGTGAYAAMPETGDSAIEKLLRLLRALKASHIPIRMQSLSGGGELHKVADSATAVIMLPDGELDMFRRQFKKHLQGNPSDFFELNFNRSGSDAVVRLFPDKLLDILFQLEDMMETVGEELKTQTASEFSPPFSTLSMNSIEHKADTIIVYFYISLLPEMSSKGVREDLEKTLQQAVDRIAQGEPKISFNFKRVSSSPAMHTDRESTFVRVLMGALHRVGVNGKITSGSACTEGSIFSDQGVSTVVFGPGKEAPNAYAPDEYNELSQLDIATRFYIQAIDTLCLRGV